MMYGPIEIWSRFVWSATRCFSAPRGPVATTREQVVALDRHAVDRDLVAVVEALALDVMDAEPLLAVEEVGQAVTEHRHLPGDRAVAGEADEIDGLHTANASPWASGPDTGRSYRPATASRSLVDLRAGRPGPR